MNDLAADIDQCLRSDGRRACLTTELRLSVKHSFIARGLPIDAENDPLEPPGAA